MISPQPIKTLPFLHISDDPEKGVEDISDNGKFISLCYHVEMGSRDVQFPSLKLRTLIDDYLSINKIIDKSSTIQSLELSSCEVFVQGHASYDIFKPSWEMYDQR